MPDSTRPWLEWMLADNWHHMTSSCFHRKFTISVAEMCTLKITVTFLRGQWVNTLIFSLSDFDGDNQPDDINFIIKRIKVHTDPGALGYKFPSNYGVETFLELFSEDNFDAFCLAYMFTYRDFEGGTLGLAWTGDLQNAGGVCEKNGVRKFEPIYKNFIQEDEVQFLYKIEVILSWPNVLADID